MTIRIIRRIACLSLLIFPAPLLAQESALVEMAIRSCVAQGFIPDEDRYELIASLPEESCVRACKAEARACRGVVNTTDRCGVNLLKATARTAVEICLGLGGTQDDCRVIRRDIQPDIDWWRSAGRQERRDCDADVRSSCLSRCQSAPSGAATPSAPAPEPPVANPGGSSGSLEMIGRSGAGLEMSQFPQGEGARAIAIDITHSRVASPSVDSGEVSESLSSEFRESSQ